MFYEDFEPGLTIVTPGRTITIEDLEAFIQFSGLDNPMFKSDDGAGMAGHSGRIVPAPMQLSMAMGLCQQAGLFDHVVVVLQFEQLRFHKTLHPGDRISVLAKTVKKRSTSNAERGLVVLEYEMKKDDGTVIMTGSAVYLMRHRCD